MEQHVIDAPSPASSQWLPITEYAVRTGISLSTIRRKIKANAIQYRLEKGRYLIWLGPALPAAAPSPAAPASFRNPPPPQKLSNYDGYQPEKPSVAPKVIAAPPPVTAPDGLNIDRTVQMISDAFEHTLREKDERIRLLEQRNDELEERLNELKSLVRALEEKYEVRY